VKYILYITLLITFFSFTSSPKAKEEDPILKILKLRKQANNSDLNISKRFEYAREAISLSKKYDKDSTVLASNRVLSWLFINYVSVSLSPDSINVLFIYIPNGIISEQHVPYDNYYLFYKDLNSRINIIIINNSLLIMTNSLFC